MLKRALNIRVRRRVGWEKKVGPGAVLRRTRIRLRRPRVSNIITESVRITTVVIDFLLSLLLPEYYARDRNTHGANKKERVLRR